MPIKDPLDRIKAWLVAYAPEVAAGLNPPTSDADIAETERFLGVRLPDDVRAAYRKHDGQSSDSPWLLQGWEWLSLERVRDEWAVWKDLFDSDAFEEFESGADGAVVRKDWWNPRWIPLTYSGSGDHDCVDLDPGPDGTPGQIIEMWHDDPPRPVRAVSFVAWLAQFAHELLAGEWVYSPEYMGLCRTDEV